MTLTLAPTRTAATTADSANAPPAAPPIAARPAGRWTVVGTVGTSLSIFSVNALQGVFLARMLGPTARGEYATSVFYAQLFTYIGLFGITYAIAKRASLFPARLTELTRTSVRAGLLTGGLTALVVTTIAAVGLPGEKRYLFGLCAAAALFLPCEHLRLSLLAVDHGAGRFGRYNRLRMAAACAFPFALACVWLVTSLTAELGVVLYVATAAATALATAWAFRGDQPHRRGDDSVFGLLREGRPFAGSIAAADAFSRLDYLLILQMASITTQGYYAAAIPAASLLTVIPTALALFAFNAAVGAEALKPRRLIALGIAVAAVQVISALAFATVLEPLVLLVFGDAFQGTVAFANALLPAQAICGASIVVEAYLRGRGQSRATVISRLLGAVALLASAAYWYPSRGNVGIPMSATVGYAVSLAWMIWAVVQAPRRHEPVPPVEPLHTAEG